MPGDDVVVLPYSSGTTGSVEGRDALAPEPGGQHRPDARRGRLHDDDVIIAVLPFFHIYGMQVLMNTGLSVGATIVTMPRFDLPQFLQLHQDHGITRTFVAPPIVVALAKHPAVEEYDLSSIRQVFSGAAPLSAELAEEAGTGSAARSCRATA